LPLHLDRFLMALHPDSRSCPQTCSCTVTDFWLRPTLYRDTAPVLAISFVTGDIPIAIGIAAPIELVPRSGSNSTKLAAMNAKTRAITSLPTCGSQAGLHRDSFAAKVPGPDSYRDCPDAASVNAYLLYCRPLTARRQLIYLD
jgi:hypothetical protein